MSDAPLVSIITPLYNSAHYMRETIDSVVSQTYMNWELILVDDCSQDNSVAIAKSYVDKRIKVLSLSRNSGAAVARNYAIESSRGTFICFLGRVRISTLHNETEKISSLNSNAYKGAFLCLVTYSHLP
ncbi:glycosyltransferase family 2 protein [Aeromonas caviae]|uniref:glycosyltransferase family 2 protein n=1 Tax=Aeromonas caviae TaxID=648 RepID=UPI00191FE902|nr:glycosyltransferase family 2 protein [Aeromonas caviae]MBL0530224.1 glycosyltransferase family 2 protein [Aeromonas caviae]